MLIEYAPVIVAPHCLAIVMAISRPRMEFLDPSKGTRILEIFFFINNINSDLILKNVDAFLMTGIQKNDKSH